MASSVLRTVLVIGNHNLPQHVYDDLNGFEGVSATSIRDGWLLIVPDAGHEADYGVIPADESMKDFDGIPVEVVGVWEHARSLGAEYVMIDDGADNDMNLSTFQWKD